MIFGSYSVVCTRTTTSVMIKRTTLFTALLLGLGTLGAAQQPDFNGTWRLNEEESRVTTGEGLDGLGSHAPETLYITQRRSGEVILTSRLPGSVARDYVIGGSTWVPAPRPSTGRFLMTSRTRGLSMISEASGETDGETVRVREVLTMDPDGRRITLEVTTTRSWGPETNVLVYDRVGGS